LGLFPLDHGEGKSLIVHRSKAGEGANGFAVCGGAGSGQEKIGAGGRGQAGTENAQVPVDVADAPEPRDDLLTDIAALGRTDGIRLEPSLGRKSVGADIEVPKR
jgi:hypothetical protein